MPLAQFNTSIIWHFSYSYPILYCSTHFSSLHTLLPSFILCTRSTSRPPSTATCNPNYLKQYTWCNSLPFSLISICPTFACLEHFITFRLPTFTLNFLLSHILWKLTHQSTLLLSESATDAVSSENKSWFIARLPQFAHKSSSLLPSTLAFTWCATPSIYTVY